MKLYIPLSRPKESGHVSTQRVLNWRFDRSVTGNGANEAIGHLIGIVLFLIVVFGFGHTVASLSLLNAAGIILLGVISYTLSYFVSLGIGIDEKVITINWHKAS